MRPRLCRRRVRRARVAGHFAATHLDWSAKKAGYNNELGYFIVDSANGSIGNIAPGQAGYAQAALSSTSRVVLFSKGQTAGASQTITLQAGQMVVFYLIQNNTTANFLAKNPSNSTSGGDNNPNAPLAFFSIQAANPDGMQHTQIIADATTGSVQYNWEDLLNLGDSDFNDATIIVKTVQFNRPILPARRSCMPRALATKNVTVNGTLGSGKKSTAPGDIGVFFVDSPPRRHRLAHARQQRLRRSGVGQRQFQSPVQFRRRRGHVAASITVPAGKYLAFYTITSGTTSSFLLTNPTDVPNGGPVALFSFDVANPNGIEHFRWTSPENVHVDPSKTPTAHHGSDFRQRQRFRRSHRRSQFLGLRL